jgi:DNA-binding CsgD family transcriptional regulator
VASSHNVRAVDAQGMELLSKREMEVVRCVAQGLTNREIADRLHLSQHTIKNCLFRVFDKLGVSSRVELLFMTLSQDSRAQSTFQQFLQDQDESKFRDEATLSACKKAAEQGVLIAQMALAQFHAGHKSDPAEQLAAYTWYQIAGEQIARACKETSKGMSIDQLLQAEQTAATWLNKRGKVASIGSRKTSSRLMGTEAAELVQASGE